MVAVEKQKEQYGQQGQPQGQKKKIGLALAGGTVYSVFSKFSLLAERREEMLKSASRDLTMVECTFHWVCVMIPLMCICR